MCVIWYITIIMSSSITITNPVVIEFFNKNIMYDPEGFITQLIVNYENKQNSNEVIKTNDSSTKIEINKDELLQFYEEYQFFINQKMNLINQAREHNKNFQRTLNRVNFQNLDEFFLKHLNVKSQTYVCNICNTFSVSTKKGLATHKRICLSKNVNINEKEGEISDIENEE
jgi:hypothetical protein